MKLTPEFIRLYARATLRARRNPVPLSLALRALSIATRIKNPVTRTRHVSRLIDLVNVYGGGV